MMRIRPLFGILFVSLSLLVAQPVSAKKLSDYLAEEIPYTEWLVKFRMKAEQQGIPRHILKNAFIEQAPIDRVILLDQKQPEGTLTYAQYKKRVLPQSRINEGRELLQEHWSLLHQVEKQYGVPAEVIVALWGIETSYGKNTGGFYIIDSLATLAYEGRRREFFEKELFNALKIASEGHVPLHDMMGSWAGAMGQTQFMPSSFLRYAVDYDRDGHKDIWSTHADIFASIGNYLRNEGWNPAITWGVQADMRGMPKTLKYGREHKYPILQWQQEGVYPKASHRQVPPTLHASLVQPDGGDAEDSYLTLSNYDVIMRWNRSTYFATSVGLLSDAIAKARPKRKVVP